MSEKVGFENKVACGKITLKKRLSSSLRTKLKIQPILKKTFHKLGLSELNSALPSQVHMFKWIQMHDLDITVESFSNNPKDRCKSYIKVRYHKKSFNLFSNSFSFSIGLATNMSMAG